MYKLRTRLHNLYLRIRKWLRIRKYGITDIHGENPVHSYFGFKMRANWKEAHHLYWGILGVLMSWWGVVSCLQLNELLGGILAPILVAIEVVAGLIWFYVALDDIYQHHRQVKEPRYHSPVHNWYICYFYVSNSWIARAVRKINKWIDSKLKG